MMKALQFAVAGSLDQLAIVELPKPVPVPGEMLIRVESAGINPSDVKNVLGRFPYTTAPRVPGRDFAGVVQVGPVALLGKRVFGSGKELGFTGDGSHAQFVTVPEGGAVELPASLSVAQAAACGVPYVTAWEGIERAQPEAGARVLVIGGGAVGRAAADLARWRGTEVVIAQRGAEKVAALGAAGYHAVPLDGAMSFEEQLPPQFEGHADIIFDSTGAFLDHAVTALAPHGRFVVISAPPSNRVDFAARDFYRRGATLIGVNSLLHGCCASAAMLREIAPGFGHDLPLPAVREWPFVDAIAAYRAVDQGGVGKVVLTGF